MKLFLDTEFTGLHQNTTLISLALVSEIDDGNQAYTFYAEFTDYDTAQIDDWLRNNVLANRILIDQDDGTTVTDTLYDVNDYGTELYVAYCKGTTEFIFKEMMNWLRDQFRYGDVPIDIWSDCLAYDWMLFCQLFGGALNLPKFINYIPFDICTQFTLAGIDPDISRVEFAKTDNLGVNILDISGLKHNAMIDALWIHNCHYKLLNI